MTYKIDSQKARALRHIKCDENGKPISIEDMALIMGISSKSLFEIETNPDANPKFRTLIKFIMFYNLKLTDILIVEGK